jgi:hypothetical protein
MMAIYDLEKYKIEEDLELQNKQRWNCYKTITDLSTIALVH